MKFINVPRLRSATRGAEERVKIQYFIFLPFRWGKPKKKGKNEEKSPLGSRDAFDEPREHDNETLRHFTTKVTSELSTHETLILPSAFFFSFPGATSRAYCFSRETAVSLPDWQTIVI
jgi:hypothetical protein